MKATVGCSASQCSFKPRLPLSPRAPGHCTQLPPLRGQPARLSVAHSRLLRVRSEVSLHSYSLMRTIGTGSFARVRVAVEKPTKAVVAIKLVSKSMVLRRNQLSHLLDERRLLESVRHPFIVEFKGAFQDQFFVYLVLEYVQGGDLYSLLAKRGVVETYDAKVYASEIVCALAYLHSRHILYRDLKPENLLLTSSGHIKLADFGFAKETREKTYTLCGTPQYLAPEVINREGHDENCDWWALGVLLYEMLTGRAPFEADSPYELYEQILTAEVHFPTNLPKDARTLIAVLLIKDPNKRASEEQIKASAYFAGLNWSQVEEGRLQPHYRPRVRNSFDTSHFDQYQESGLPVDERLPTKTGLFAAF